MYQKKKISKEQALMKIKQYCAYQERCHKEVKDKLYSFGLYKNEVEEIISNIIENNYLNEERFAVQYAGGKFRMKHWGRVKIVHSLKQKQVSTACIKIALKQIEADYLKTLNDLAEKKWKALTKETSISRKAKVYAYLQQKGFENNFISEAIKRLSSDADLN